MKKIPYIILGFAFSVACSLLEENPNPILNEKNYYKNEQQCWTICNGVYIPSQSIFNGDFLLMTECQTDLWYCKATTLDSHLSISPGAPGIGESVWRYCFRGVDLCNEAIHCLSRTPYITDSLKNMMVPECRVMRAFYYYFLTNIFDGVPYYTCQVNTYAVQDSIRYLPRTDANTIRRYMYDDLKNNAIPYFTKENGLKVRACEAPSKRSGYALGLMLMAKFAMWYGDWDGALEPLHALEELYGDFNAENYPLSDIMWSRKHTGETIFEIQNEYNLSGVQHYGNMAKIMMPNHTQEGEIFDGVRLPGYGTTLTGSQRLFTNYRFAGMKSKKADGKWSEDSSTANSLFGPLPLKLSPAGDGTVVLDMDALRTGYITRDNKKYPLDRRAAYKFGMGNLETGDTFETVGKTGDNGGGHCFCGMQFWCPNILNTYDSNNYRLFRYADAILMMAECYCHESNSSKAIEYLNKVRRRAGVDDIANFSGYEDLMLQIRNERARELAGELHRKFDLVRWGIWYDQTYSNTDYSALKNNMRRCHEYYPIPDSQCSISNYTIDNPAYKE